MDGRNRSHWASPLVRVEQSASLYSWLTQRQTVSSTQSWVGSKGGLDETVKRTFLPTPVSEKLSLLLESAILGWVHTACRNTVSWQCGQDPWPRNASKVGYAVTLRAFSVWKCNVTLHVDTCSGRNRIIPLMRQPNTDSTPKKPVTLPRNKILIRYAVTSLVHTVTIQCYDTR
jgi:hypothetical protein